MSNTQEISLKLTIEQVNLVLGGLGEMPFNKVYALIQTIQQQAQEQLGGDGALESGANE